jgi:ribosomal protein S9
MATTFKVRENKNWYRENVSNKEECRWEVVQFDDGKYAATTGYSSSDKTKAQAAARDMQADEDAGVTIGGMAADDHRAAEAGMATALLEYYDALPTLVAAYGVVEAEARHPWRSRQTV